MILSTYMRFGALLWLIFFTACKAPSAEKAFDVAVLNSNMYVGFANTGMERELESPSVKMGKTKAEVVPMTREEAVMDKLKFEEENYAKLQGFSHTDETKEIIQKSIALHELMLPVYKNEYVKLATLYDGGASKNEIEIQQATIRAQYAARFEQLYGDLISCGKRYAKQYHIEVRWAM